MEKVISKNRKLSSILVAILSITMVLTSVPVFGWEANAASTLSLKTPAVVVTGQGLIGNSGKYSSDNVSKEVSYSLDELKALGSDAVVSGQLYSAKKSKEPYAKNYFKVDGVKISALLGKKEADIKDDVRVVATDGYATQFLASNKYENNGKPKTIGIKNARYFFNLTTGAKGEQTPAVIAWASADTGLSDGSVPTDDQLKTLKSGKTSSLGYLRLYCGQYDSAEDMNQPLFNGNDAKTQVNKVVEGADITEVALKVQGEEYTRADVLLMQYAERTYSYTNKSGAQSDTVRGVPMSVLLKDYDKNEKVTFEAADGYDVTATGMTVKELIEKNYILAYEVNGKSVYATAKSDNNIYGFFALYGDDGSSPAKLVNSIAIGDNGSFVTSVFKHITNGGISGQNGPYNIDAITGATLTIEGPGAETSVPLAVKDLESQNAGCYRGEFTDVRNGKDVTRLYEGVDLYHVLNNMQSGTNGIKLTKKASKVSIRNQNRDEIATFSIDEITQAHNDGRPILVAYGTAYTDSDTTATTKGVASAKPFVFDFSAGGDETLGNYDGCLKLVYDRDNYGASNTEYKTFSNMAYIYVEESTEPGYKHDKGDYKSADNSEYILTLTGDALGYEVNYTVDELEKLVEYDEDGNIKADSLYGFRAEYSLANSTYWYVNEYEGVKLWALMQRAGLSASKASDKDTEVSFRSTDNYGAFDKFTLAQVADDTQFSFYKKNTADPGDGTYKGDERIRTWDESTKTWIGDKFKTGYPVLVAYGVNKYPYVQSNKQTGYLSGLQNDGGPLRVIWGKTDYAHANGSNQAKLVEKVIIGTNNNHYVTHKYNTDSNYTKLADSTINVKITSQTKNGGSQTLTDKNVTVGEVEDIIYDGKLTSSDLLDAKVKAKYVGNSKGFSDIYEGVNLQYFLKDYIGLTGTQGTVTFIDANDEKHEYDLAQLLNLSGYNNDTGVSGLAPVLAYGKNGYPLVSDKEAAGYVGTKTMSKGTKYENDVTVKNQGGPLEVLIPSADTKGTGEYIEGIKSIEVNLETDKYAHIDSPYSTYAKKTITVKGSGTRLSGKKTFKVSTLEGKQSLLVTADYSFKSKSGKVTQRRYRGVDLYNFLKSTDVGLKSNAAKVRITTTDGKKYTYSIDTISNTYTNTKTKEKGLPVILAFGSSSVKKSNIKDGKPLVTSTKSKGYKSTYGNSGGPLKLIIGQKNSKDKNAAKCVKNVKTIEVIAGAEKKWGHNQGVFKQYLTDTVKVTVKDQSGKELYTKKYTVKQLEAMTSLIERTEISTTGTFEYEGLVLSKFLKQECKNAKTSIDKVSSVYVIKNRPSEVYKVDILGKVGRDQLLNGVKDGENRVPILLSYAVNGYPLAFGDKKDAKGDGYDSTVGNDCGPIRLMVHKAQGACISEVNEIEIILGDASLSSLSSVDTSAEFTEYVGTSEETTLPPSVGLRSTSRGSDGSIYIGTYGGGLSVKAKGTYLFTTYNTATTPALETGTVSAVAADKNGGVWFSQNASYTNPSDNRGLMYMDKDGNITTFRAGEGTIPNDYVQALKLSKDGRYLWIGSFGGLTRLDTKNNTWKTWDKNGDNGATKVNFPAESVSTIELDKNGGVWVGFYPDSAATDGSEPFTGGFAYFKSGKVKLSKKYKSVKDSNTGAYRLGDVWVRDIAVDSSGTAWIVASGSYKGMNNCGGKLWRVSNNGKKYSVASYTGYKLVGKKKLATTDNSELRAVAIDPDGGLWFGTSADGLIYCKSRKVKSGKLTVTAQYSKAKGSWDTMTMNNVYSIDFYGRTLYAGTAAGLATKTFKFKKSA